MTSDSRGRLIRLAIAVALAVVATGVSLLFASEPIVLLAVYVAAVGVAAWKGGWQGGVLATALSTVALLLLFAASFDESHLIGFIAASVIVTAIMEAAVPHRRVKRIEVTEHLPEYGKLTAVEPPPDERERSGSERRELAQSLERAAAAQLAEQRQAARSAAPEANVTPLTPKDGTRNDRSKRG